jgi:predicted tellurium resistance membrane protein TerC
MHRYLIFASIGFELLGIMLASIYLGQTIDEHYQTKGVALIALMFIGLASWLFHVIMLLRQIEKNQPKSDSEE